MPKTAKKDTLKKHKDKAWKAFSLYIRLRDCLETTGTPYEGDCFTCYARIPFKGSQAGHFIQGRHNAVLFSEDGVHLQCPHCNLNPPHGLGGNYVQYFLHMEQLYGREFVDRLLFESKQTVVYKKPDYDEIADLYTEKYKKLMETTLHNV